MRQVNCNLGKHVTGKGHRQALALQLGINPAQMTHLCDESWTSVTRADLHQLLLWWDSRHKEKTEKEHIPLFEVVESPIWATFAKDATVMISKGNTQFWDGQVDSLLRPALDGRGCKVDDLPRPASVADVRKRMKTSNCIFIGGPKRSNDCDLAISALYEDAVSVPFRFLVVDSQFRRKSKIVAITDKYDGAGIYLRDGDEENYLNVDWRSEHDYERFLGRGIDAGVLIVCRRPFKTPDQVSTVILAGYSGFGTYAMCQDLVSGGVHINESELEKSAPVIRIMRAAYKKETAEDTSRTALARGSRWFAPPWNKLDWRLGRSVKAKQPSVSET